MSRGGGGADPALAGIVRRPMRPLRQTPHLTHPVWGGNVLARMGKGSDPSARIGESWEIWRDNPLPDGRAFGGVADLPLLIKLLDVRETLSVQVHPGDEAARRLEGLPHGKTEGWVVLCAEPGARVAYGLNRELGEDELRERALSGAIEEDLAWREVRAGDVIDVPAGTIHAIGGGILLYEVQQPCDLTYRLYDWGRPRPLHLDRALAVARRSPCAPTAEIRSLGDGREELLRTPWYVLERARLGGVRETGAWEAITVVEGALELDGERIGVGGTLALPPGRWALDGEGTALVARAGDGAAV